MTRSRPELDELQAQLAEAREQIVAIEGERA
jgi:hypothetical protein